MSGIPEDDFVRENDPLDVATSLAARLTEASIEHYSNKARPEQVKNPDGTWPETECCDCGEDIGEARLEARGAIRCVTCQALKEQQDKMFAR